MNLYWKISLVLITATSLNAAELTTRTQVMMGTFVNLTLPADRPEAFKAGFEAMRSVERSLSGYDSQAEIYRLNETGEANLSVLALEALALCRIYHEKSGGVFNPAIGAITLEAYRFGRDERVPDQAELDGADIRFGALRLRGSQARLEKGVKLDLGGMGKGFAVDKAAEKIRALGVNKGVIAASGDIRCLDVCRAGIENPFEEGVLLGFQTPAPNWGVSTSGNYRRYVKNQENNHLITPDRRSQKIFASVTLAGAIPNSDLDAYATAVSVMPPEQAESFAKGLGVEYLLILTDGSRIASPLFEKQ